jgi:hypothetical protein
VEDMENNSTPDHPRDTPALTAQTVRQRAKQRESGGGGKVLRAGVQMAQPNFNNQKRININIIKEGYHRG